LKSIFGLEAENWILVKSYTIKEALPAVNYEEKYKPMSQEGIFYCGDYLLQSSINGAMESGRRTAEEILKEI
jgi:predicted NAD/FAD-dependent oxidoreductase